MNTEFAKIKRHKNNQIYSNWSIWNKIGFLLSDFRTAQIYCFLPFWSDFRKYFTIMHFYQAYNHDHILIWMSLADNQVHNSQLL